ncbi:MAG: hypothetical protein H7836_03910 [Magnetococcus sp. YQC-3]
MRCFRYREAVVFVGLLVLSGCGGPSGQSLPAEEPAAVAKQFYDYISDASVQGGSLPLKEAHKMVSVQSRVDEAKFVDIAKKYPPGFRVDITGTSVEKEAKRAAVTISYRMPSLFGNGYTVSDTLFLVVDAGSNTWKVDFTGESDAQDVETMKKQAK